MNKTTESKQQTKPRRARCSRLFLPVGFLLGLLLCVPVIAQETDEDLAETASQDTAETTDGSQSVDQSEESFRRRMELRDQRFRQRPRADMGYTPSTGNEKLDFLPQASQQHIKEQIREMIISSGQWQPGEDMSDYPYEASPDAQNDTGLHEREREAWAEQLQKYQQREAAAYAASQNNGQNQQNVQQGGQQGDQQNNSQQGQSDSKQMAQSDSQGQNQTGQPSQNSSPSDSAQNSEEISTEGVSENALAFLQGTGGNSQNPTAASSSSQQGQDGQSGEESDQDGETASESSESSEDGVAAEPQAGTLAINELAMLQGMSGASQTMSLPELSSSDLSAEASNDSGESPENPAAALNLDGTLLIGELRNLNQVGSSSSGAGAGSSVLVVPVPSEEPSSEEP